ncbi:unnamed protein product, partial [Prorocentrum cordatum]
MGGMGTWELGAERPELYAAVAPVAAYHNGERTEHIARRLRGTPVFVIHSLHDGVCPHSKEVPLWTLLREEGNRHLKVSLAHHVDHTFMFERAYCDDVTISVAPEVDHEAGVREPLFLCLAVDRCGQPDSSLGLPTHLRACRWRFTPAARQRCRTREG